MGWPRGNRGLRQSLTPVIAHTARESREPEDRLINLPVAD